MLHGDMHIGNMVCLHYVLYVNDLQSTVKGGYDEIQLAAMYVPTDLWAYATMWW